MTDPLAAAADALAAFRADPANLARIHTVGQLMAQALTTGHKVLACGNGGSLCDAMHFCEELTGRFRHDRRPLPAIACIDPGHITCTANDYGYDHVFSRWVQALGNPGDILVALSTSGNSPNVIRAVEAATSRGLTTVALLGKDGGRLNNACTHQWIAPGQTSDRIQELHMLVLHALVEKIEAALGSDEATK